MYYYFFIFYKI